MQQKLIIILQSLPLKEVNPYFELQSRTDLNTYVKQRNISRHNIINHLIVLFYLKQYYSSIYIGD